MKHSLKDSCRADQCSGPDCAHCRAVRPLVRAELPAPGTPQRAALDRLIAQKFPGKVIRYDD